MVTHYTIGTGQYRTRAPFSELRNLLEEGHRIMQARGLEGEALHRAARIFARTYRHYYEQNGGAKLDPNTEEELVQRVMSELGSSGGHPTGYSASAGSTVSLTRYDPRSNALEPIRPAILPDLSPHKAPGVPEEYVEPAPDLILDRVSDNSFRR